MTEVARTMRWCSRLSWRWVFEASATGESAAQKELVGHMYRAVTVAWSTEDGSVYGAWSAAFDGCEDKDLLARTLEANHCANLAPATALVTWTDTQLNAKCYKLFECKVAGDPKTYPVFKLPLGSSGEGVTLCETPEAALAAVRDDARRAQMETALLDRLRSRGNFEPAYVIQEQIGNSALRTSVRVYLLWVAGRAFIYSRCEARDALGDSSSLRGWFLTNGSGSDSALRRILSADLATPYLLAARAFAIALADDFEKRAASDAPGAFAFAGIDYMLDENDSTPKLLELNHAPAAPPPRGLSPDFRAHLLGLAADLLRVVPILAKQPRPELGFRGASMHHNESDACVLGAWAPVTSLLT